MTSGERISLHAKWQGAARGCLHKPFGRDGQADSANGSERALCGDDKARFESMITISGSMVISGISACLHKEYSAC